MFISLISLPSILICPAVKSQNLKMRLTIEDFPEPDGPTIAIDSPCIIFRLTCLSTSTFSFVGYAKDASMNSTTGKEVLLKEGETVPETTLLGSSIIQKICSQMPMAEIVWFIMPERLAKPTVRVIVQSTKLVRSPIESSPSITSWPPKQRMLRMRKLANRVMTRSIIPQKICFFLPTSKTFLRRAPQLLLQMCSLEKERTTLILPNTSVAKDVAQARLFEYSF